MNIWAFAEARDLYGDAPLTERAGTRAWNRETRRSVCCFKIAAHREICSDVARGNATERSFANSVDVIRPTESSFAFLLIGPKAAEKSSLDSVMERQQWCGKVFAVL
jgi:hypothetical protein